MSEPLCQCGHRNLDHWDGRLQCFECLPCKAFAPSLPPARSRDEADAPLAQRLSAWDAESHAFELKERWWWGFLAGWAAAWVCAFRAHVNTVVESIIAARLADLITDGPTLADAWDEGHNQSHENCHDGCCYGTNPYREADQ